MKWGFFLIIFSFLLASCSNQFFRNPASLKNPDRHIVFDIDWTIVSNYEEGISKIPEEKILVVEGKKYIPRDGLIELMEFLISKNIHISFFSGGQKSRNIELLSKIKLTNGKSLLEIAYRLQSFEDLTQVKGVAEDAKFIEKYKKDLTKITPDLNNVILFDDGANFYAGEAQKENLIHLGPAFKYFENFSDAKMQVGEYVPKTFEEFSFDRKKMYLLKKLVSDGLEIQKEDELNFKEAINIALKKIDLESGTWNNYTESILREIKVKIPLSNPCSEQILPFLVRI